MKLSIIGPAGRKEDANRLDGNIFHKMFLKADEFLHSINKNLLYSDITLVSGGAAYSDHIAVLLFLKYHDQGIDLTLHLPTTFDNGEYLGKTGSYANYYHQKFSQKCDIDSLKDIQKAIDIGAVIKIHKGFHKRNDYVADCDYLLAFSFGETKPDKGGTLYTWNKSKCTNKINIHIPSL